MSESEKHITPILAEIERNHPEYEKILTGLLRKYISKAKANSFVDKKDIRDWLKEAL